MRTADRLNARLGKSEVLDLACSNQILYRSRHIFNRHVRVYAMLVEQVDSVDLEALERGLRNDFDMFRVTVQTSTSLRRLRIEVETELGGDHYLAFEGRKCFAHKFLVGEGAVDL